MMPYVLMHLGLFGPLDREASQKALLWLMEAVVIHNCKYLLANPQTPRLYDSGVRYAVPEQMAECKVDPAKLGDLQKYLRKIGASADTAEAVVAFVRGIEVFRDIPQILNKKFVDCDNLSMHRSAELRVAGVGAKPYLTWRENNGGVTYHATVLWPDGTHEDPSLLLGMGGESRAVERAEEVRKNHERWDNFVEAARQLCVLGQASPAQAGAQVNALGLLPRDGSW